MAVNQEVLDAIKGMSVMDLADLVKAIEEEFGSDEQPLEISDEDAENIRTVNDAVTYLSDRGISG